MLVDDKPLNNSAAVPFVAGRRKSFADELLHQGLEQAAIASTPEGFIGIFAQVVDEATVAVPGGILLNRPALNMTQRIETLVTRIPKAPFLCVIILDLLYVVGGIILTVAAVMTVMVGPGIRDAQARLSTAAVVAECFESPALGDDATDVKDLYAEQRGMPTRRIALNGRKHEGRRYGQVVPEPTDMP